MTATSTRRVWALPLLAGRRRTGTDDEIEDSHPGGRARLGG